MSLERGRSTIIRIIKHIVIYKTGEFYSSFPWVERLGETKLIVAFRQADGFSKSAAEAGNVSHHDGSSWIAALISEDDGESWLLDSYRILYRSRYGVNDPGLTKMSDGRLILRLNELDVRKSSDRKLLQGRVVSHRPEFDRVSALRGNVWVQVDFEAQEASREGHVIECGELTQSCSREAITELPDGTWVLPVYKGAPFVADETYLVRSYDHGATWHDPSIIFSDPMAGYSDCQSLNFNETSIISFGDGEMLAISRTDESFHTEGTYMPVGGVGWLHSARSYNWGLSWTKPNRTQIFGQPAHLLRLNDQRILCTYGYRRKPYGIRAILSSDRGKTWDPLSEIILRDDGSMWDLGYPTTIQLANGNLLTVYYFNEEGKTRYIAGTIWALGDH